MKEEKLKAEIEGIQEEDLEYALNKSKEIKEKFSTSQVLRKYRDLVKAMFSMVNDFWKGEYQQAPWLTVAAIVFALLYVFNPFDMIPDFLPGVGYLDDLSVFAFVLRFIEKDLHQYLDWRIEEQK